MNSLKYVKRSTIQFIAVILMYAVMLPNAMAWEDEGGSPLADELVIAEQDLLFQGIQGLIGETANIIVGADAPDKPDHMIAVLSNIFNYGMLSIALLFMAVRGVVWLGQLNSEKKDGSMLDFQSAPVAVIMAIIVLLPFPNGYSLLQHVVIKVAGESISIANQETNALADFMDKTGTYAMNPTIMNTDMIALNMFDSAVCMSAINKETKKNNVMINQVKQSDFSSDVHTYMLTYDGIYSPAEAVAAYKGDLQSGFANGRTLHFPKKVCGFSRISFGAIDENYVPASVIADFRESMQAAYWKLNTDVFIIGSDFVEHLLEPVSVGDDGPIYNTAYPSGMDGRIKAAAIKFKSTYQSELERLVSRIRDEGASEGSALMSTRSTENLKKYGTGFLGVYFWEYARRNNVISNLTQVNKSSGQPAWDMYDKESAERFATTIASQKSSLIKLIRTDYLEKMPDISTNGEVMVNMDIERFVANTVETAEHGYDMSAAGPIFKMITNSMYGESDPFLALADTGHQLIVMGETILTVAAASIVTAKIAQATADGGAMASASNFATAPLSIPAKVLSATFDVAIDVAGLIIDLAYVIIFFGIIIAFWIPSIPLYHWVAGMIGFMIVFMQAFILTPLLALAHLLSGEKGFFSSKTQHGYMAIIQLATYLPIMVIAFVVAYLVTMWGAKFLQIIYLPAMEVISGTSIAGIITIFVITAIFIIFNIQIANRGFSLITTMAEKAGKFIGGGEEMLGDSQGASSAKGAFVAFNSSVRTAQTSTMGAAGKDPKKDGGVDAKEDKAKINSKT